MAKKKSGGSTANLSRDNVYDRVPIADLLFDPQNPRLVEFVGDSSPSQHHLLKVLWEQMAVDELAMSIAASGYFDYEPLFVVKEKGKLFVIEGNRRLAAVKLLLDRGLREQLRATDLPAAAATVKASLATLPVIFTTRQSAWQYLGFKHVNGPAKWDSYAKAQYIAEVHHGFGVPLEDIARQIGDKHNTVQRLFRALMVIGQAEKAKVFARGNRYNGHFSFSHLYTGLDYEGIAGFINLKTETAESTSPVPQPSLKALGELCTWLFGDKTLDIPPVVQSQNPHLRQLDEVLRNKSATESLRAGLPLSVALDISLGDEQLFQRSLRQAKDTLMKAKGTLTTGYSGEQSLLHLAGEINDLAYDLYEEMERKRSERRHGPRKRRASR